MPQTVSLSFYRFASPWARMWAFAMMGLAKGPIAQTPDIGFWKLCGSGKGEGFTPRLYPDVFAILATWPNAETAKARLNETPIFQRYASKADENWTVFLTPTSTRGHWSGEEPFEAQQDATGALAALTRATIKPKIITRFWGRVPNISDMIGQNTDVAFKIGIGELPLFQQVTFSIWPSKAAMDGFARTGPHAEAIKAVREDGWFKEELYARFVVQSDSGTWGGKSPLDQLEVAA
ncbi:MAG: spheroidene monooxygenase [Pseudomonadota bacterium]